jgi:hypothetical protein
MILDECCSIPLIAIVVLSKNPTLRTVIIKIRVFDTLTRLRLLRYSSSELKISVRQETIAVTEITIIIPQIFSNFEFFGLKIGTSLPTRVPIQTVG